MLEFLFKHRSTFVVTFLTLASMAMIISSTNRKGESGWVEEAVTFILYPFQKTSSSLGEATGDLAKGITRYSSINQENKRLRAQNTRLIEENNKLREDSIAIERLRRLLGFRETTRGEMLPAQVIGKDASNWFKAVVIDKGGGDDIEVDMVVASYGVLVGRVAKTTHSASKVMLITDLNSRVGALIQRSRVNGIAEGQGQDFVKLRYIPRNADVKVGDLVVSSGLGGIFPKGLIMGKVIETKKESAYGLFQEAKIAPTIDFSKMEEVFVIKNPNLKVISLLEGES